MKISATPDEPSVPLPNPSRRDQYSPVNRPPPKLQGQR